MNFVSHSNLLLFTSHFHFIYLFLLINFPSKICIVFFLHCFHYAFAEKKEEKKTVRFLVTKEHTEKNKNKKREYEESEKKYLAGIKCGL